MFGNLSDIIKIPVAILIGILLTAVVLIFFYEGLRLPIVGQVIDGRVQSAAKVATSQMVAKFERDSLAFQLAKERRDRIHAEQVTIETSKRADVALRAKTDAEQALEARIKADTDPDGGRWTEEDEKWNAKR
jgi:flagellar basal body-associated protein FliL